MLSPFVKIELNKKLYFDAKHLKRDWIGGGDGALFLKKVPFLANIRCFPNFLDYAPSDVILVESTSYDKILETNETRKQIHLC